MFQQVFFYPTFLFLEKLGNIIINLKNSSELKKKVFGIDRSDESDS